MLKKELIALLGATAVAVVSCTNYQTTTQVVVETEEQEKKSQPKKRKTPELPASKPNFAEITDIPTKKKAFFDYLRPGIEIENLRIEQERALILALAKEDTLSVKERLALSELGEAYNLAFPPEGESTERWFEVMKQRVDFLPEALVLTQAANESAWGTSRFATEASNYFGQWCYSEGCGLIPNKRPPGMTHEVAKFSDASESTHRYFMNVNRNPAYVELRELRLKLREQGTDVLSVDSALELAGGLIRYSERGQYYVDDIRAMIRHNDAFWQKSQIEE
ncbi:glucosaminidase domain-containing protein [Vibrio agarivorans]|uniref:Glucosaminidase domain-containing protein n=1 Tax=Vibrio agarivorans TaxID=153622 RepID=A0ABT7XZ83_9VIBR|nr:glucosaminidase domain-containing protein [Vibrio agarivorans]MDN2481088.1 glucosaminidase domain-containing protein [Vibrio agarivorans]